jgi:serpin B
MGAKKVLAFSELNNSLWADKGISLNQAGVDKLALDYNCDLFKVNFSNNEARRAIASYIKDKTHGLVDGDVEFNEETIIALINTFYLKEVWNSDGDELRMTASEYSFARADGGTVSEKFLEGYYFGGKAYDGDGYSAFYTKTNHNFSIKFILPDEGVALSEVFTAANIHAVNSIDDFGTIDHQNKKMHYTRAIFPEYKADYDDDISDILKNDLGIRTIFDESRSDFSGITDTPAYCSKVIHKCSLDVNRKGIEGAAVTIVALDGTSGPLEEYEKVYHDFVVNRAFGFVITDSYGAVLFSGVVNGI